MKCNTKISWGIAKVNDLVSIDTSGSVLTAIGSIFNALMNFVVPLNRGIVEEMNDTSLGYPRGHISHKISIDKDRDQDGLAYRGNT